jgi:cholesterol transport system auxiliary component
MTGRTILLFSLLIVILPACVDLKQPYQEIKYYTMEYPPPELPALAPLPGALRVERFTISPDYAGERIIYRDEAHARNTYAYHRWRARPDKMVRDFLARDFRRSGVFQGVFTDESGRRADYALEGSVEEFLEWDEKEQWLAVLTVAVTLLAPPETNISERIIFQKTFSARRPAAEKHPQAVAEAMSKAMAEVSAEIIRTVHAAIAPAP